MPRLDAAIVEIMSLSTSAERNDMSDKGALHRTIEQR